MVTGSSCLSQHLTLPYTATIANYSCKMPITMAPSCSSSSEHMALPYSATIVIYSFKMTITLPAVPLVDLNIGRLFIQIQS